MKHTVVFVDRDGTIHKDENYFLGCSDNWKEQLEFLKGVVEGINLLNKLPDSKIYIITNQAGVALTGIDPKTGKNFDNLTLHRIVEVNEYIIKKLREKGANVNKWFACPYIPNKYVELAKSRGWSIDEKWVDDNNLDWKPKTGMIDKALENAGLKRGDCEVFVIGDRTSDVKLGLNCNATSILVSSSKTIERGDIEKVKAMEGDIYVADDFLDAAKHICNRVK